MTMFERPHRDHDSGEGRYEQSESVIQRLLGVEREPVRVGAVGVEAPADRDHLRRRGTYLGFARRDRASHWALVGEWTIRAEAVVSRSAQKRDRPHSRSRCLKGALPRRAGARIGVEPLSGPRLLAAGPASKPRSFSIGSARASFATRFA